MWLRALVEVFKGIWSVLSKFGVSAAIISGTSAIFMAGWASIQRQDPWFLGFVGLVTFAAVLSIYVIVRVYIRTWRDLPNYEQWDLVDPIHIWQAACLWAEKQPIAHIRPGTPQYGYLHVIKAAMVTKKLPIYEAGKTTMWTRVMRDDLRKFIETTPERPLFIFKELRR